jgi:hypothetical protein
VRGVSSDLPEPVLDVRRIVETLNRHGVEYLLVGGASATAYGAQRASKDVDVVAARDTVNMGRLADSLKELNARLRVEGLSDEEARALPVRLDAMTLRNMELSTWRTDAGDLDILCDMPSSLGKHQRYEELLPRAETAIVGSVTIRLASLDDVIASKEWADRPKDREALPELYDLRARRPNTVASTPDPSADNPLPGP